MKAKANSANKRLIGGASAVAIAVVLYACGGDSGGPGAAAVNVSQGTVLLNANVVNTRDGSVSLGMSVIIDGGKIQQILPAASGVNVGGSAQAIDASGKFVVPGYLDLHSHTIAAADQTPNNWPLLIANGITGVREMNGSPEQIKRVQQLNADSAAGRIDAPEVLTIPGDIIGLAAPPAAATSAPAAVAEVQKQKAYGAGFIKTIRADRAPTLALLSEAKNQGTYVAGHLSPSVGAKESSDLGWKAIEHFGAGLTFLLDCSSNEDALRASLVAGTPTIQLRQAIIDSYDDAKCQALAKTFVKNETWNTPTLLKLRTGLALDDPQYRNDPNLIYVSKATRAAWEAGAAQFTKTNDAAAATLLLRYFDKVQSLTKLLKQNGVKMMAGSDTSTTLAWVIPGFSLHQEFGMLAKAGLTPLEILQMTTLNGAEFFGRQSTMGTVDVGKNADLVVLDANPVLDAGNMSKIAAVVLKGKYFSKAALEQQKASVAAAYASAPAPTTLAASVEPAHTD